MHIAYERVSEQTKGKERDMTMNPLLSHQCHCMSVEM